MSITDTVDRFTPGTQNRISRRVHSHHTSGGRSIPWFHDHNSELFEEAAQPMFQSSVEGKLVSANKAMLRLLGYGSFEEVADLDIPTDLYADPCDRELFVRMVHEKGVIRNVELRLKRKNGRIVTVVEHCRALRDESGDIAGFEGTLEDITFRKALEKRLNQYVTALEQSHKDLEALNAQKDKLFSVLAHDLRSPFASILGFCDILLNVQEDLKPEERVQFVRYIRDAATDQLNLVNKLLDWSRLESDRVRIDIKELDLVELAKRSVNSLGALAIQNGIQLSSTLAPGMKTRGDSQLLQQVFNNIIGNALKFTPQNGTITVHLVEQTDRDWVIGVTDNGVGIPQKDHQKLFRIEEKYTRKGVRGEKGTGLGLPVCYEIMQKHAGDIRVTSEVDKGTTILLSFQDAEKRDRPYVLVVDDEDGVRVLHSRFVRRALPWAEIVHASDGEEAFEIALTYTPCLIITDYDMPVINGYEFLKDLKQHPDLQKIPVIVITGQDSRPDFEALTKGGALSVLQKPVESDLFVDAIRKAVHAE